MVLIATLALPVLHTTGGFGRAAGVMLAAGAVGLTLVATRFPYTEVRPKRITIAHVVDQEESAIRIRWRDRIGLAALDVALAANGAPSWTTPPGETFTRTRPAPPPPMPAPKAQIEAQEVLPDGNRRVSLRIFGTSPLLRLAIPKEALLGWSLAPSLTATPPIDGRYFVHFNAIEPAGATLTLTLRGRTPIDVELRATDGARPSGPEITAALNALPPWVTANVNASWTIRLRI